MKYRRVFNKLLFLCILVVLFSISACSQSNDYADAYKGCRVLPGAESVKLKVCPRLAELIEKEAELKKRIEKIKDEQQSLIVAITTSQ